MFGMGAFSAKNPLEKGDFSHNQNKPPARFPYPLKEEAPTLKNVGASG